MRTKLRAVGAVAAVYGYFLIFAQFAFVELLRGVGVGASGEKVMLGMMAVAGVAAGFAVARRGATTSALRASLGLCALAGALAPWAHGCAGLALVAVITGMGVGAATVSLAALLPGWCTVAWTGLGTGLGYAVCNVPWVFSATPGQQAWVGVGFALVGAGLVPGVDVTAGRRRHGLPRAGAATVLAFLALVWLDSAAFFIIQHERELKEGTWGPAMLWRNAGLHLGAALVAGWWLAKAGGKGLLFAAWAILAAAALAVNEAESRTAAGWLYPVGVSLYSTALVAWPGFGMGEAWRLNSAATRAAWVFAVGGWFGSANGIGMAQSLHRVPTMFVVASGFVVALAVFGFRKWRMLAAVGGVALAVGWLAVTPGDDKSGSAVDRGRAVYLAEGCIGCHSSYVREGDPDGWGPPSVTEEVLNERPVVIGNRRQGPDLAHVGARRSAAWLREHFMAPRKFVKSSAMPSYAHLFEDRRGEDLIDWLMSGQDTARLWRAERAASWVPAGGLRGDGRVLFSKHCAVCHGEGGSGDGELAARFAKRPTNLVEGPFVWTADRITVARAIRWGLPGTDMPGHELLSDGETEALAEWVMGLRRSP